MNRLLVALVCIFAIQFSNAEEKQLQEYCSESNPKSPNAEIAGQIVDKLGDLRREHDLPPLEIPDALNVTAQMYTCKTANNLNRCTMDIDRLIEVMVSTPAFLLPTTCYLGVWVYTFSHENMTVLTGQVIWADCNFNFS